MANLFRRVHSVLVVVILFSSIYGSAGAFVERFKVEVLASQAGANIWASFYVHPTIDGVHSCINYYSTVTPSYFGMVIDQNSVNCSDHCDYTRDNSIPFWLRYGFYAYDPDDHLYHHMYIWGDLRIYVNKDQNVLSDKNRNYTRTDMRCPFSISGASNSTLGFENIYRVCAEYVEDSKVEECPLSTPTFNSSTDAPVTIATTTPTATTLFHTSGTPSTTAPHPTTTTTPAAPVTTTTTTTTTKATTSNSSSSSSVTSTASGTSSTTGSSTASSQTQTAPTTPVVVIDCDDPKDQLEKLYCGLINEQYPPSPGNISNIMNSTLENLDINHMTGEDLYTAVKIFELCSKTNGTTHEDFHGMSYFLDRIIEGPDRAYKSGNDGNRRTGFILVLSIQRMLLNAPDDVSYLNGKHVALVGRPVDCSGSKNLYGLSDQGSGFDVDSQKDQITRISIDSGTACLAGASRVIYSIYRSPKFFLGNSNKTSGLQAFKQSSAFVEPMRADSTTSDDVRESGGNCYTGFLETDGRVASGSAIIPSNTAGGTHLETAQFEGFHILHRVYTGAVENTLVELQFSKKHYGVALHGKMKVTWFDHNTSSWSRQTCAVSEKKGYYVSRCTHLTDFTLIVDGSVNDAMICDTGLQFVSYFVAIASILCLILLNFIYIGIFVPQTRDTNLGKSMNKYIPNSDKDRQMTVYVFLQLVFFTNFTIFFDESRTTGQGGCTAVAVINYWVLMSCIALSLFQSWKIMKQIMWTSQSERFFIKLTQPVVVYAVSFGLSTILSIGFGASTKGHFFYRNDSFCWIRSDYLVGGVIIPLTILGLNALVCSFLLTLRMFPGLKLAGLIRGASVTITTGQARDAKDRVLALFFAQFTLGVPWLLQYLTLFKAGTTFWHFLFSIIISSQGVILLLSFAYRCYSISKSYRHQHANNVQAQKNRSLIGFFTRSKKGESRPDRPSPVVSSDPSVSRQESAQYVNSTVLGEEEASARYQLPPLSEDGSVDSLPPSPENKTIFKPRISALKDY